MKSYLSESCERFSGITKPANWYLLPWQCVLAQNVKTALPIVSRTFLYKSCYKLVDYLVMNCQRLTRSQDFFRKIFSMFNIQLIKKAQSTKWMSFTSKWLCWLPEINFYSGIARFLQTNPNVIFCIAEFIWKQSFLTKTGFHLLEIILL